MDVFQRSLDSSDALISSINVNKKASQQKNWSLTPNVIELLESLQCFASSNVETLHNFSFDDDSDDSESENINPFSIELDVEN